MSKRRKLNNGQRTYQVPSLQSLALAAVRKRGSKTYSHSHSNLRESIFKMADSDMGESRSSGTQTTSAAKEGAKQVGQGHQVTVPRNVPHLYNNNYTVRLSYCEGKAFNVSMHGGYSVQSYMMNTIYDPDVTGTGHQPILRDLWASQYDYYAVLACDYEVEFYNCSREPVTYTGVGTNAQLVGGVTVTMLPTTNNTDVTTAGNGYQYPSGEMKNGQTKPLWPDRSITFSGTLTPGDFIVDAKDQDTDNTWTAVGSNPAVPRYLGFVLNSITNSAIPGVNETPYALIEAVVTLHYTVQFTQLNQTLRAATS